MTTRPGLLLLAMAVAGVSAAQAQPLTPMNPPPLAADALSACDAPSDRVAAYRDMQKKGLKTRAEVRADTLIWIRAGMDDLFRGRQRLDMTNPVYRERYAEYVRMRNGPEYAAELCRQLAG